MKTDSNPTLGLPCLALPLTLEAALKISGMTGFKISVWLM